MMNKESAQILIKGHSLLDGSVTVTSVHKLEYDLFHESKSITAKIWIQNSHKLNLWQSSFSESAVETC